MDQNQANLLTIIGQLYVQLQMSQSSVNELQTEIKQLQTELQNNNKE